MNVGQFSNLVYNKLAHNEPPVQMFAISPIIIEILMILAKLFIDQCQNEPSEAPKRAAEVLKRDTIVNWIRYRSVCRTIRRELGLEDYRFFAASGGIDATLETIAECKPEDVCQLWQSIGG